MLRPKSKFAYPLILLLLTLPVLLFAQDSDHHLEEKELHLLADIFEWIEFGADIVGITILVIGFLKGTYMFIRLEYDRLTGRRDYEELFSLRNILGTYIIISLDFLIVSDIVHSVVSPELTELLNLGIIVILRTAIGYFLGKELQELRHEMKSSADEENHDSPEAT